MIVKLKGNIENFDENFIDLDVNGVVYRVLMSNKNISKIGAVGSYVSIFIYEIRKEDSRIFAGFLKEEERETFGDLLSVQGVGGKMAINIMSNLTNETIIDSIVREDSKIFNKINGVGNKLAMRLINELKEKIKKKNHKKNIIIPGEKNSIFQDLVSCLLNLGFPEKVCETTANYVINNNQGKKLEELIPIAVKSLSNPSS